MVPAGFMQENKRAKSRNRFAISTISLPLLITKGKGYLRRRHFHALGQCFLLVTQPCHIKAAR